MDKTGATGPTDQGSQEKKCEEGLNGGNHTKRRMFEDIRPDLKGLAVISKLALFHDDGILRAVADELAREGIEIVSSTQYLPELVAPQGCLTKRNPNKSEKEDIDFGFRVAKELGRLDIGQCVVVKKKTILAVEAIEGTDAAIRRGGDLAREGAVVVKVSKPNQDLRFDVPAVGLGTVKTMGEVKAATLAVESGKTLLFDKDEMITYADKLHIAIVSV